MRSRFFGIAGLLFGCVFASGACRAQEYGRDGFNFSVANTVYRSVGGGVAGPNYVWSMGVGFGIGSQVSLGVRALYGNMLIPTGPERPIAGAGDLGGVGFEGRLLLSSGTRFAPYVAVGYDIVTILHTRIAYSDGYNGSGDRGAVGCEYALSRLFGVTAEASYCHFQFGTLYTQKPTNAVFAPFDNDVISFGLSLRFYPDSSEPQTEGRSKE